MWKILIVEKTYNSLLDGAATDAALSAMFLEQRSRYFLKQHIERKFWLWTTVFSGSRSSTTVNIDGEIIAQQLSTRLQVLYKPGTNPIYLILGVWIFFIFIIGCNKGWSLKTMTEPVIWGVCTGIAVLIAFIDVASVYVAKSRFEKILAPTGVIK